MFEPFVFPFLITVLIICPLHITHSFFIYYEIIIRKKCYGRQPYIVIQVAGILPSFVFALFLLIFLSILFCACLFILYML